MNPRGRIMEDPLHNESGTHARGAEERTFLGRCLVPAVGAALLLSLYLMIRGRTFCNGGPLWQTLVAALLVGMAIYAVSWIVACPPNDLAVTCDGDEGRGDPGRGALYWLRDFASWSAAGGVYGAIIGLGVYLVAHFDLWFLIGNVSVSNTDRLLPDRVHLRGSMDHYGPADRGDDLRRADQLATVSPTPIASGSDGRPGGLRSPPSCGSR